MEPSRLDHTEYLREAGSLHTEGADHAMFQEGQHVDGDLDLPLFFLVRDPEAQVAAAGAEAHDRGQLGGGGAGRVVARGHGVDRTELPDQGQLLRIPRDREGNGLRATDPISPGAGGIPVTPPG